MARPPLPPGVAASHSLTVRLTDAEHAALLALVAADDAAAASTRRPFAPSTPSGVVRGLVMSEARRRGLVPDPSTSTPIPAPVALPRRPTRSMPAPAAMLAQLEALLASTELRAKDAAAAAGLTPQDVSTFRQGKSITNEKRAKLWAWMCAQG